MAPKASAGNVQVEVSAPDFREVVLHIRGTVPFVQLRFSEKAKGTMLKTQMEGQQSRNKKEREAKDPAALFEQAMYRTPEGKHGIPASSFRNAMIRAASLVGLTMTATKMTVFVQADGFDADDGTPLVLFTKGEPRLVTHAVRNQTGVADVRVRAMWDAGWEAVVRVVFDGTQFSLQSVVNLLARAGLQVGVGEGRPFSKNSAGMGWGLFETGVNRE